MGEAENRLCELILMAVQWIKEGKNAVKWTRLSCHDFIDYQVRLRLFVLAYNLGNFFRQTVLPKTVVGLRPTHQVSEEITLWRLSKCRESLI